jgi:hypothetical protein
MSTIKNSIFALSALLTLFTCTAETSYAQQQQQAKKAAAAMDVNIVNTPNVQVTNTPSVRDADNPTRQPVQASAICEANNVIGCLPLIYTVPAGKRLVIEFASMDASLPVGQAAQLAIQTTVGGETVTHHLPLTPPAVSFQGQGAAASGQQVRLYADAGTGVTVDGTRNIATGTAFFNFSISGYLVDVQ